MTYQEVKQMLKDYLIQRDNVRHLKALLEQAKTDRLDTLHSIDYTKPRYQGGKPESPVEQAVMRADAVIEKHRRQYEQACEKMFAIEDTIASMLPELTAEEQNLIIERYMQGVQFYEVARRHYYTPESLLNKYTRIYRKLSKAK